METQFDPIRLVLLICLALAGNITGFYLKDILGKNGYVTYWYRGHLKDIFNFVDLIDKTTEETSKKNYTFLIKSHVIVLISFIGLAATFIFGYMKSNNSCGFYTEFLNKEVKGQLAGKFMDRPNHNFPTLVIKTNLETHNDTDLTVRNSGLYDSVKVGDEIRKLSGDSVTYIMRQERTFKFIVHKTDCCKN